VRGYRRYRLNDAADEDAAGIADVEPGMEALAFFVSSWLRKFCALVSDLNNRDPGEDKCVSHPSFPLPNELQSPTLTWW